VFSSERGASLTARAFQLIVARSGQHAGFTFPVHPHMLRHSTGFALANAGEDTRAIQAFLGHRNIQHTVTYTGLVFQQIRFVR
jgi:type 1 fimbriae regulatory protein FimE